MWTPALIDNIKSNIDQFQSHACDLLDVIDALKRSPLWSRPDRAWEHNCHKIAPMPCHHAVSGAVRYVYYHWRFFHSKSMSDFTKVLQRCSWLSSPIFEPVFRILHHETHTQSTGSSYRITQLEKGTAKYLQTMSGMLDRFNHAVKLSRSNPSYLRDLPLAKWTHELEWYEQQMFQFEQDIIASEMGELEERREKLMRQDRTDRTSADECNSPTWRKWRLKKEVRISVELRIERMRGSWWERKAKNGRRSLLARRSSEGGWHGRRALRRSP